MEKFVVSARKYRPSEFDEVVGQSGVTQTLEKAVNSKHLGHSFLFCGPRGVGKTTCARILSRMINKQSETDERDYSINIFELDAASNNSVDDIKMLIDQVRIPPQIGDYKVYIIDEVHMLSQAAFNAFLKTLEEPPSYAIFILATTEKHKILPTILSRCQIYDFKRISISDIVSHLAKICEQEGIDFEESALNTIAQKADGALRDALSMFDRLVDRSEHSITFDSVIKNLNILDYDYYFKATDLLMAADLPEALLLFDEVLGKGFDGEEFITGLTEHFRNLMISKEAKTKDLLEAGADLNIKYQQQSQLIPTAFLLNALNLANECQIQYRAARNKRLQLELCIMKIAHLPGLLNWDSKKKRQNDCAVAAEEKPSEKNYAANDSKEALQEPRPEENTRDKPEQNPEPKNPKETLKTEDSPIPEEKTQKPERKKNEKSKGFDIGVNLNKLKNKDFEAEAKKELVEEIPRNENISETELKAAWEKVIHDFKENDKIFYPILEHSEIRLIEGEAVLVFDTTGSRDLYESRSTAVMKQFFNYLGSKMPVNAIVEKAIENKAPKKAFTSKDKLALMEEKNPNLKILKEKLQLYLKD